MVSKFALCSILLCLVAAAILMVGNRVYIFIIGTFCLSGKLSVDKLRLKLDNAMKKNDPDLLEKVIAECVGSGHVELTPDIQEARLHLKSSEEIGRGVFLRLFLPCCSYLLLNPVTFFSVIFVVYFYIFIIFRFSHTET